MTEYCREYLFGNAISDSDIAWIAKASLEELRSELRSVLRSVDSDNTTYRRAVAKEIIKRTKMPRVQP